MHMHGWWINFQTSTFRSKWSASSSHSWFLIFLSFIYIFFSFFNDHIQFINFKSIPIKQVPCTTMESTIYFTSTIPKELFGVTLYGATQCQRISSIGKNFNPPYTHPNPSTNTGVGPGRPPSSQVKDLLSSTPELLTSGVTRSNALLYLRINLIRFSQNGLSLTT
jgi:hypothetical protein